jgi:hypothetical protein
MEFYWNPVDQKLHVGGITGPVWLGRTVPGDAEIVHPQPPQTPQKPAPAASLGSNLGYQFGAGALESAIPTVREGAIPTTAPAWVFRGLGSAAGFGAATQAASVAAMLARKNPALALFAPAIVPVVTVALTSGPLVGKFERHEPVSPLDIGQAVLGAISGLRGMGMLRGLNTIDLWKVLRGSVGTLLRFAGDPKLAEELAGRAEATGSFKTLKEGLRLGGKLPQEGGGGQVPAGGASPLAPAEAAVPAEPKPVVETSPSADMPSSKQVEEAQTAQRLTSASTIRTTPTRKGAAALKRLEKEMERLRGKAKPAGRAKPPVPAAGAAKPTAVQQRAAADAAALQQGQKPQGRVKPPAAAAPGGQAAKQAMAAVSLLEKNPDAVAAKLITASQKGSLRDIEPSLRMLQGAIMRVADPAQQEKLSKAWFALGDTLMNRTAPLLNTPEGRAALAKAGISSAKDLADFYGRFFGVP